jgi:hypothetical protein
MVRADSRRISFVHTILQGSGKLSELPDFSISSTLHKMYRSAGTSALPHGPFVFLSALVFTTFNLQPQRQTATPSPIPERPMSLQHSGDMTPKRSL